ncbi:MAG: hypothetical protein GY906_07275 [bacterium]|nr:hypothetical protein [bacterium]
MTTRTISICVVLVVCSGLVSGLPPQQEGETDRHSSFVRQKIDRRSYALGAIAAFSEMVDLGIKKLGFSATFKHGEVDALLEEAEAIARKHNVKLYRESDLIVTDLFPADVAENMEILIIYSGDDIDDYLALKSKKQQLVEQERYDKTDRRTIAYELGKLLSYPDVEIERLLTEDKKREP